MKTVQLQTIIIELPKERPLSWNKIYAGKHWIFRKEEADRVHQLVDAAIRKIYKHSSVPMLTNRVDIFVTAYFDKYSLDSDNIGTKMYVDGIKKLLIKEDSRKFVRWVAARSEMDKANPRVEIEIKEVDDEIK